MHFNGLRTKDMSSDASKNKLRGELSSALLKKAAYNLGFSHVGIAPAESVPNEVINHYEQWLRNGCHGDMQYLEKYLDVRRDPRLLLPGAKTVVSLALSYNPGDSPTQPSIAWYAQGRDYHDVAREKLRLLAQKTLVPALPHNVEGVKAAGEDNQSPSPLWGRDLGRGSSTVSYHICVDTAPILEKYWAWRCGLGWIGRHTQLVIPHEGSAFFLCELLLTLEADEYDEPMSPLSPLSSHFSPLTPHPCGSCHRCVDACPTGAISADGLDARRCLSYLTIEHRGPLPPSAIQHLKPCFYGCDRCLRACLHLSREATSVDDFHPSPELLAMTGSDWSSLTPEQYRELFRASAVKRAKYDGLMRNISASGR